MMSQDGTTMWANILPGSTSIAFDQLSAIDHSLMPQDDGFPSQASTAFRVLRSPQ